MKLLRRFALLTTVCLTVTSLTFSQTGTTSLRGTVTDPSGSVVPGATVILKNLGSNTQRSFTTSSVGEYQFLLLAPGSYSLTITAPGFERY
ncbi:MAG TPA: carboxypeptidase-like regulatory domain-containing protein, partial [Terriglobales bacterium]|nr:carboxypeptidase-like regulatory domain-containing protein [Terriglobales bacterium]